MPFASPWNIRVALAAASLSLLAASADAQLQRRFVSAQKGNDANDCSAQAPCRTFARAAQETLAGGEIIVMDSGGYGQFVVSKSLHIKSAPGAYAGISVFSGTGITVSAGETGEVTLSGLNLVGLGGTHGIVVTSARKLRVSDCDIRGFNSDGLRVAPVHNNCAVFVEDSHFTDCVNRGIYLAAGAANTMYATIESCAIGECGYGLAVLNSVRSTVNDTVFRECSFGVTVSGAVNITELENCRVMNNIYGLESSGVGGGHHARIRCSNCQIYLNSTAINRTAGADIVSFGNNRVMDNTNNEGFAQIVALQ